MPAILEHHWHHLPLPEVLSLLETNETRGLDTFDIVHRQEQFGPNVLTPQKGKSPLLLFFLQFHQPLVYILLAAAVMTAVLQEWADFSVIFGVVLVNAVIGFVQESKALKAIDALARSMDGEATVIRSGHPQRVSSTALVPGDIVILQAGDKVPADLRFLRNRDVQIDESALTGESVPVMKHARTVNPDALLADRANMAYSSTLVTYGQGVGVVVAIGDMTEIGRIHHLIASADVLATPLTKKITHFSFYLLWVILGLAGVTFLVGWMRGEPIVQIMMAAVALAVGAIPEGLPAAMTITLAIGVTRMAHRHAIVRKLPAVETLGSTTVICSDKTGTLTQNQMTVQEVLVGDTVFTVSGVGYSLVGTISLESTRIDPGVYAGLLACLTAGVLCNDSRLVQQEGRWEVEGDPTEGALLASAGKVGLSVLELSMHAARLDAIPFESQYQYMATLHATSDRTRRVVYLKGAVERVLPRCLTAMNAVGQCGPLDSLAVHRQVEQMTEKGLRVLAFAIKYLPPDQCSISHDDVAGSLIFLGLQGMMDPPRAEAIQSVKICQRAGIQVKMITGDHLGTAAAVAKQIGLNTGTEWPTGLSGHDLATLTDEELIHRVNRTSVFARVAPEQKLRLVEALQATGHVVAMTGDGVNDAPALKQADIGIAMGLSGTEVAKEAADMVLTDDNFSSIEAAVEEGRGVFDNLVKFITWTLPTNIGEGLVIVTAVFAGVTLPILPVQILWINMTTAVLLGLMLAFEGKEPGLMTRAPREPSSPILSRPLIERIGLVGVLLLVGSFGIFEWELSRGNSIEAARTSAVNMFVLGELFYLFNCRSLEYSMFTLGLWSNPWLWVGVGSMMILQLMLTYLPVMNQTFGTAPLGYREWGVTIAVGLVIYGIVGLEKLIRRRGIGHPRSNS